MSRRGVASSTWTTPVGIETEFGLVERVSGEVQRLGEHLTARLDLHMEEAGCGANIERVAVVELDAVDVVTGHDSLDEVAAFVVGRINGTSNRGPRAR
jgi:hypothetical protein